MAFEFAKEAFLMAMSSAVTINISISAPSWMSSLTGPFDQQVVRATAGKEPTAHQQQGKGITAPVQFSKHQSEDVALLKQELALTKQQLFETKLQLEQAQQQGQGWQKQLSLKATECLELRHQLKTLEAHSSAAALEEFVQLEAVLEGQQQELAAVESGCMAAMSELLNERDQLSTMIAILSKQLVDTSCSKVRHQADALVMADTLKEMRSTSTHPEQQPEAPTAHMQQPGTPNVDQEPPLQPLTPQASTANSLQQHEECVVVVRVDQSLAAAAATTPMESVSPRQATSSAARGLPAAGSSKPVATRRHSSSSSKQVATDSKVLKHGSASTAVSDSGALVIAAVGLRQRCSGSVGGFRWRI